MLALLRARNIVTPDLGPFPRLNPEYVVRHDPDVIIVTEAEVPRLYRAARMGSNPRGEGAARVFLSPRSALHHRATRSEGCGGHAALEACLERVAP